MLFLIEFGYILPVCKINTVRYVDQCQLSELCTSQNNVRAAGAGGLFSLFWEIIAGGGVEKPQANIFNPFVQSWDSGAKGKAKLIAYP